MTPSLAAARHYYLVALYLLGDAASSANLQFILAMHETGITRAREDFLEWCALEIVGIAFTSKSHAVLVNAFGPIFFVSLLDFQ